VSGSLGYAAGGDNETTGLIGDARQRKADRAKRMEMSHKNCVLNPQSQRPTFLC